MSDAIDELAARSKGHPELREFHALHRAHPELLDFLVVEIRLRIARGLPAFSYHSLWHYARWKLELEKGPCDTFMMDDHAASFYARAITILHPEFNGRAEYRPAAADDIFGLQIAEEKQPEDYARRLEWADGTALEDGWRPTIPHVVNHTVICRPDIHPRVAE